VGSPVTVCSTGGAAGTNSNVSVSLSTTTGPTGISGPYGSTTTAVVATQQGAWHAPIGGSLWITYPGTNLNPSFPPAKPYDVNAPNFTWYHYSVTFTVDAGYTGQITSGSSYVDNLIGNVLVDNTGTSLLSQPQSALYNAGNYNGATPLAWSSSASGITAGPHTVDIYVENNDSVQPTDPTALDFCFTVTQTLIPPPPVVPLFVIGDKEAHAIGDNVNFWGAQWWKNNFMTGQVDNGVAAFKGYAVQAGTCGETWTALPGNSGDPPFPIADNIAVIVTSEVLKNGNNISGDIRQIVMVHQDGHYNDNPGHAGNGPVTSIVCTAH